MGTNKKLIIAIAAIAVIILASVGTYLYHQGLNTTTSTPSPSPTASPTSSPTPMNIALTDDTGYTLILTEYPERIVSLAPANTQILFAVGAGDKVVGVTDYDYYPYNFSAWVEAGNMTSIGSYFNPAVEPIVALNPDLVLASLGSSDQATQLRSLGLNVLTLNPKNLTGIMDNIITVGEATGHQTEATNLVANMQMRIDAVVNGLNSTTAKPRVYIEIGANPYYSVGKGTFIDDLIQLAGGQNIFENSTTAYPQVSSEAIIEQNPDIIVFPSSMGTENLNPAEVASRPGWSTVNAVTTSRIYTINGDMINQPGPRQVDALEILAKIIHPEIFGTYTEP
jgi:iron complex transport system substrate-binding protein